MTACPFLQLDGGFRPPRLNDALNQRMILSVRRHNAAADRRRKTEIV